MYPEIKSLLTASCSLWCRCDVDIEVKMMSKRVQAKELSAGFRVLDHPTLTTLTIIEMTAG
jgi:hypothetical protein